MPDKIKIFKQKFDSLTYNYINTYHGRQPIMTIIDGVKVKVELEFLNHLPPIIKLTIISTIEVVNG
jgi:hypothetical protein